MPFQFSRYAARLVHPVEVDGVTFPEGSIHLITKLRGSRDNRTDVKLVEWEDETKSKIQRSHDVVLTHFKDVESVDRYNPDYPAFLQEWFGDDEPKPGPPKQFPHRMEFRYDDQTKEALSRMTQRTGDDASTVIRRLIQEAK